MTPLLTLCPLSKWGGVCWYYWYVFVFFVFFNLVLPFFFMKTVACVEVHCGTCMCCGRVSPPIVPPSSPATTNLCSTPRLRSLSASRIALNDDATQPHFRNKSVCLWVVALLFSFHSFISEASLCSLAFLPLVNFVRDPYQMFYQGAYQLVVHPESVMLRFYFQYCPAVLLPLTRGSNCTGLCQKENREWGNTVVFFFFFEGWGSVCVCVCVRVVFLLCSFQPRCLPRHDEYNTEQYLQEGRERQFFGFLFFFVPLSLFFNFLFYFQFWVSCVEEARFEQKQIEHECKPCSSTAKASPLWLAPRMSCVAR